MALKKLLILLILSLISNLNSYAQFNKIAKEDALVQVEQAPNPIAKVDSIILWNHKLFMSSNFQGAEELLMVGIDLAKENEITDKLLPLYMDLGRCLEVRKDDKGAIKAFQEAFRYLNDKTNEFTGKLYYYTGRSFQKLNQFDSMLYYYQLSAEWNEINEPYRNWIIYEAWHNSYVDLSDYDKALEYLLKAYAITKPVGKRMDHGMVLFRLRSISDRLGNMEEYAKYTMEYYDLVDNSNGSNSFIHGFEHDPTLPLKEQVQKLQNLVEIYKKNGYLNGQITALRSLGDLYFDQNLYDKALPMYEEILSLPNIINHKFYQGVYDNLVQIYDKKDDFKSAYKYLRLYNATQDSLINQDKRKLLFDLEKKYQTEKKEQELAVLSAENELKEVQISNSRLKGNALLTISFLLVGLLAMLFYYFNKKKKTNLILEQQNAIINKNLKEKDVLLREIHHRVKNNLQVVSSLLSLQSNYIEDVAALKAINEGKDRVSSMALIHQNLYKDSDITGIETQQYFNELIDHLFDSYNIMEDKITLIKEIESLNLDVDTMIPLGLVANELISNALKHGFKGKENGVLKFVLKMKGGNLYLSVEDDGVGVDENEFLQSKSFGNKMISAFKQKLGAELVISNSTGTLIELIIKKYKLAA